MYKSSSSYSKYVPISAGIEEVKFHKNGTVSLDNLQYKIRDSSHRDITNLLPPPLHKILITAQELK